MVVNIFGEDIPIKAAFKFLLANPDNHFVGNVRSAGAIMNHVVSKKHVGTPDIDNLVKFVMDKPMKGVFFGDDSQVCSLQVRKEYDVLENCCGHIEIGLEKDV
jgi:Holliday junction resolvase RusA-like endonuclease